MQMMNVNTNTSSPIEVYAKVVCKFEWKKKSASSTPKLILWPFSRPEETNADRDLKKKNWTKY